MTTPERAEINRRNAQKSTGPRTSEGKARSRLNAVKHGMTATIPVLPGEDGEAFLQRMEEWTADLAPCNAVERFLVERAVTDSWKIERADRVEAARLTAILRPTSAGPARAEMDEAAALGRRLICEYDEAPAASGPAPGPGGPIAGKPAASGVSGSGAGPRNPRAMLDRLESTAAGCRWLRDKWAELRGILDRGDTWSNYDLGTAIYLMGLEPVRREDEVWEYLLCKEPDPVGVEEHRLQLGRQLDETITSEGTRDRAVLRPIVDRAIARLDQLLTPPTGQAEAEASEMLHRLAFDADADAQLLRRYQFDCGRSLRRTLDTLLKLRRATARTRSGHSALEPADPATRPGEEPLEAAAAEAAERLPVASSHLPTRRECMNAEHAEVAEDDGTTPAGDDRGSRNEASTPAGTAAVPATVWLVALLVLLASWLTAAFAGAGAAPADMADTSQSGRVGARPQVYSSMRWPVEYPHHQAIIESRPPRHHRAAFHAATRSVAAIHR